MLFRALHIIKYVVIIKKEVLFLPVPLIKLITAMILQGEEEAVICPVCKSTTNIKLILTKQNV